MGEAMKYLLIFIFFAGAASAEEFPIKITNTRTLAALPDLCPSLQLELNRDPREPWDDTRCLGEFALRCMGQHNLEKVVNEMRLRDRGTVNEAREPFKLDPIPEPPATGIGAP